MRYTIIIPARLHSSRLPEKPLALIEGVPMVVRVAQQAMRSNAHRVVVATDHPSILEALRPYNIEGILTKARHPTGTDRLAEAVSALNLEDDEIVVNVQGDEPLLPPEVMDQVANLLAMHPECAIATAAHPIRTVEAFLNPNVVKVEMASNQRALTFSRAPIPWPRDHFRVTQESLPDGFEAWHHIGLYAYRVSFLKAYPTLAQAPIEKLESLEQLRALYYGYQIAVATLNAPLPHGVDTLEDLEAVRAIYREKAQ